MTRIKGITVKLYINQQTGTDGFGEPVYEETPIEISNVLVQPVSSNEVVDSLNLYGKKAIYNLGIPKTDTNDWRDKVVEFYGNKYRTFGEPLTGIEANIPLDWNTKVQVYIYE